ncbi:MAG TPA: hypothetical protein VNX47_02515 [Nevskia sp.]|jgi:hypothetical protein|nr:hypothetical protein [Nevskia sp.]
MIRSATSPISGNAVLLYLAPAKGIQFRRVLRRPDANFAGATDPAATIIFQGSGNRDYDDGIPDITAANGSQYFYKDYGWNGTEYLDDGAAPVPCTPASIYTPLGVDVRLLLKQRLVAGFADEITRGLLQIKPPQGGAAAVAVQLAPPAYQNTAWPVASIGVANDAPGPRGIGESLEAESIGGTEESMLESYSLQIDVWSQNADERRSLSLSLRRIIQANLPVFAAFGIQQVEWRLQDVNLLERSPYPADLYLVNCMLNFVAPAGVVAEPTGPIMTGVGIILYPYYVNLGVEVDNPVGVI